MPTNKELEVIVKRLTESVARLEEAPAPGRLPAQAILMSNQLSMVWQPDRKVWAAWWANVQGVHEDPKQALEILFQRMTKSVGG